jgi:hypothetical protein
MFMDIVNMLRVQFCKLREIEGKAAEYLGKPEGTIGRKDILGVGEGKDRDCQSKKKCSG